MSLSTLLNTIRDNASAEYAARVPVSTDLNLTAVGDPILTYTNVQNEFLSLLINKIAMTIVHNKTAANPLAILKRGGVPLGFDVEEIFTNPAKAETFSGTIGETLLDVKKPDTKVLYHRLNRQDTYTVTVSRQMLKSAFTSFQSLENLIQSIANTLYSGDSYDEFILMKRLMRHAVLENKIKTIDVTAVTDEASAKELVKAIQTTSKLMTFPSSNFNVYLANKPAGDTGTDPLITWTPKEDQVLIIRSDLVSAINIDVLATAFNLGKVELNQMMLEVDSFGEDSGTDPDTEDEIYAILADKAWFQIYDNLTEMGEFYNAKGLYWNYFWHHWQTYSHSLFANAVAFIVNLAATLSGTALAITAGEAANTEHSLVLTLAGTLFSPAASTLSNWTITGEAGTKVVVQSIVVSADKKSVTVTTKNSALAVAGSVTMKPKAAATVNGEIPADAFTIATVS